MPTGITSHNPLAAADIRYPDCGLKLRDDMTDQRKKVLIQTGLFAVFRHDFMKTRVTLLANAATPAKTIDNLVLNLAKHTNVLGKHRNIVGRSPACQQCGMASRKQVGIRIGHIFHNAPGDHGAQPFQHIAPIKTGMRSELLTTRAGWFSMSAPDRQIRLFHWLRPKVMNEPRLASHQLIQCRNYFELLFAPE